MQKLSKKKNLLIIILALGLILFFISQSNFFSIKKVEVFVTNRLDCANQTQLKDSLQLLEKNIFYISNETLTKKIKDKFYCVKNVTFSKNFIDKVEVNISGREPVAYLVELNSKEATDSAAIENIATPSASESQATFLIDNEGVVFAKDVSGLTIPKIFASITNLTLGQKLEKTSESLKILDKIKTYGLDEKISAVVDESFVIFSNPKVIFKLETKVEEQLASLQLILNKAKIDADQLEFIDLRFDKPVVKIAPKKNG